jgi:tRNA nucleotidyltransferase (CCA-adding enzyme)
MQDLNETVEKARKLFVPSVNDKKKLDIISTKIINSLSDLTSKKKLSIEFKFSGSYAKGTWVKGESDIDILAIFQKEADIKNLNLIIPKGFVAAFGTRKYFRGYFGGAEIEIVPIVKFSDIKKVKNSIDLSILHADYINSSLSEEQKNDVIILKVLCKANGCYGSETYMHGFSGYALEVMINKFGSLAHLIDEVETWKEKVVLGEKIGITDYPIYLPDPTNASRNICASVSLDHLSKFIFALKQLKISPSISLFLRKSIKGAVMAQKKRRNTMLFTFTTPIKEPKDMFLSKYVKNANKLLDELRKEDIEVYSIDFDYSKNNAVMFMQVANTPKTKTRAVYGPSVFSPSSIIIEFMKVHRDVFIVENRLCYDKIYGIKDFNKFILLKIKEYMSQKSILNN